MRLTRLIDGAIDVFTTSGTWLHPVRFITKSGFANVQPSTLAEIHGTPNPVRTELPFAEALTSDLMVQPGSVIWIRPER